jgi:hypothetical protein
MSTISIHEHLTPRITGALVVLLLIAFAVVAPTCAQAQATAAAQGIYVDWPDGWEMQPLSRQGKALHLLARQRINGEVKQQLQIAAVAANASPHPVTPETLRATIEKLRDAVAPTAAETNIPLQPFHRLQGFYFSTTDKRPSGQPGDFPQMIEGVFLSSGYLVNVTLLTHDASDANASAILKAFETIVVR